MKINNNDIRIQYTKINSIFWYSWLQLNYCCITENLNNWNSQENSKIQGLNEMLQLMCWKTK